MDIRKLKKTEIDRVADIWLDTNIKAHAFVPAEYWKRNFDMVKEMLSQAEVYVYENKNGILGFIGMNDEYIEGIFVSDTAQSQGIGKQLLDFIKDRKETLRLSVYQKNGRAVNFYQREEFEIQCENKDENTGEKEYEMIWRKYFRAGRKEDNGRRKTMEFKTEQGMPTNFRDLGGIRTKDGKQIAKCRILRSGDLSQLTKEAEACLQKQYQLREILDLRTQEERVSAPDHTVNGAVYHVLDFFAGETKQDAFLSGNGSREQLEKMRNVEQVHAYMMQLYRSFVTGPFAKKALKELVGIFLRTENGAVLFHCFAGKDRTGISAAVLLTLLGVSKEDIFKDYLQTNELRYEANQRILDGAQKQMEAAGIPAEESVCRAIDAALNVDKRYLEACYDEAEKIYGSFEKYIFDGIGITEEERKKLRELYLQ